MTRRTLPRRRCRPFHATRAIRGLEAEVVVASPVERGFRRACLFGLACRCKVRKCGEEEKKGNWMSVLLRAMINEKQIGRIVEGEVCEGRRRESYAPYPIPKIHLEVITIQACVWWITLQRV